MQPFTAEKLLSALRTLLHHAVPRADGKAWHLPMLTHDHYEAIESAIYELEAGRLPSSDADRDEARGLYGKYIIGKANGEPVDPDADYFVLRLDTDPAARRAALAYSNDIQRENPELAFDLLDRVSRYEAKEYEA